MRKRVGCGVLTLNRSADLSFLRGSTTVGVWSDAISPPRTAAGAGGLIGAVSERPSKLPATDTRGFQMGDGLDADVTDWLTTSVQSVCAFCSQDFIPSPRRSLWTDHAFVADGERWKRNRSSH